MSRSALAYAFPLESLAAAPALPQAAPWIGQPVAANWQLWVDRLDPLLEASCLALQARGHRARRLTLIVRLANGRTRRHTLTIDRPSDATAAFRPAALGLLRLLVDQHPAEASRLSLVLGCLVEGAHQPIRFERFLARKRTPMQRLWARLLRCF